jgi:cephalosporin hydroxylase
MTHTFQKHKEMEYKNVLIQLGKLLEPKVYVEVGTQKGATFNAIVRELGSLEKAIGIDIKILPSVVSEKQRNHVQLFEGTSEDFVATLESKDRFIDFLFIDADHSKDSVLKDFNTLSPFVHIGSGLVFFHDTHPTRQYLLHPGYCNNAWEAARTIFKNSKYRNWEIVTLPGPYGGLSIARNAPKHLNWK